MLNLRTFDLNLLRVFEAVNLDRSVGRAAEKLGMSQPAVSNALNRLRRQLNDPLFVRTPRGVEPTPKAQQIALAIGSGLNTIRSGLTAGMLFDPAHSQRRFTLLMTDVGEITFLPYVLKQLSERAPNIDMNVIEAGMEAYGDLLESGIADLAVGRLKLGDKFCCEPIHTSPFVVLMSAQNSLVAGKPEHARAITYDEYVNARHVLVQPRGASGDPIKEALGEDAARRRVALSIPHATVLPMIMAGTELMATVPKVCVHKLVATGVLCAVPVPFPIEQNRVGQWFHRRNTADLGHRWLRELFASVGV